MPVTRFAVARPEADAGITIRLVEDDPQSVVIRFFDTNGADITEAAQRKIERLFLREDFRRVFPGEIGDIGSRPATSSSTAPRWRPRSTSSGIAAAGLQGGGRLLLRLDVVRDAQRPGQAGRRRAGGQPVRLDHRDHVVGPPTSTPPAWPAGAGLRAPLGRVIDPDGEHLTLVDDTGHVLSDDEALLAFVTLVAGHLGERRIALPLSATSHADTWRPSAASRSCARSCRTPPSCRPASEPGVGFAASTDGGFILPASCPPSTGPRPW